MASSGVEEDSAARRQEAKKFDVFAFEETLISSAMLGARKVQSCVKLFLHFLNFAQ